MHEDVLVITRGKNLGPIRRLLLTYVGRVTCGICTLSRHVLTPKAVTFMKISDLRFSNLRELLKVL